MALEQPFSKRNRYRTPKEITLREVAPENLRYFVLQTAKDLGWGPASLRSIVCRALRVSPDPGNWTEYPNVNDEVSSVVSECEWFKVYDIIEALYAAMAKQDAITRKTAPKFAHNASKFAEEVNEFFVEGGIGWQLVNGQIVTRGTEAFEAVVSDAMGALQASERPTAASHLHEALQDLSGRPKPGLAGAVYHAMGALECLARDVTGDPKATLGEVLKRNPGLLPKPLDTALSHVWGYASNEARHVEEGREPGRAEAELLVGLCATVST
jgi:AbiJ N-terminal domain 4